MKLSLELEDVPEEVMCWVQMFYTDGSCSQGKRVSLKDLLDGVIDLQPFMMGRRESVLVVWGGGICAAYKCTKKKVFRMQELGAFQH